MRDLGLDFKLLLALGINDPNVNKSFKSKLAEEPQKRGATHFLDVGTCSIHIVNNAFLEGIKYLKDNVIVDPFAIDLQVCPELTGVTTNYVIKHCQTCWTSASEDYRTVPKIWRNIF